MPSSAISRADDPTDSAGPPTFTCLAASRSSYWSTPRSKPRPSMRLKYE